MFIRVLFESKFAEILLLTLILTLGFFCIYTPEFLPIRWGTNHAPQIMLLYFGLGITFFLFKKPKLTFVSFACCASLCIFLKETTHGQQLRYAVPTNQPEITIAHFNVNNFEGDYDYMLNHFENSDADMLSIQSLDLEWDMILKQELLEEYPYQVAIPSVSFNGIGIYSKHPFRADTFYYEGMPNILGEITLKGYEKLYFVSSHTVPTLTDTDYQRTLSHLQIVTQECGTLDAPLLTFGDYHLVPWSSEIQVFKEATALNDSRIGFAPSFVDGKINFLDVPQDHIFYSSHFKCTAFSVLNSPNSAHMGITGTFELLEEGVTLTDASLYHPDVVQ